MKKITVTHLGHSRFLLNFDGYKIVCDPYENSSVPGLKNISGITADMVTVSHDHHDHNAEHLIKIVESHRQKPNIIKVNTFHDKRQGAKRGKNIVHIFEFEDFRIAHFGDIGHIPTKEQMDKIGKLDVAIVPIGGFYTVEAGEARQIVNLTGANTAILMHYRSDTFGFDVLTHLDDAVKYFQNVTISDSDTITLKKQNSQSTIVLRSKFS
jgi:L-ascorbate metabolism protein UlaG (beta-lactamase superfamily)